ncbi:hypothetical protein DFP72DRAFT_952247 [Ephemerocybe angulata]|uniref:Uncharacterized protein n=1 Tax=Ephemerocybe angulata TaxID=980116 RepID=A0A8H6H7T5_9AGAR|nr:hypothetical protein DFP72DRAFT_952247 [Tulosesus angulatus]
MKAPIFRHARANTAAAISKCSDTDIEEHPSAVVENHLHPNPPATCDFPTTFPTFRPCTLDDARPRPSPSSNLRPHLPPRRVGPRRRRSTSQIDASGLSQRPNAQPTNVNMKGRMVMLWKNKAAWKCDYLPGAILKAQWRSLHDAGEPRIGRGSRRARQQRRAQSRWDRRVCFRPSGPVTHAFTGGMRRRLGQAGCFSPDCADSRLRRATRRNGQSTPSDSLQPKGRRNPIQTRRQMSSCRPTRGDVPKRPTADLGFASKRDASQNDDGGDHWPRFYAFGVHGAGATGEVGLV